MNWLNFSWVIWTTYGWTVAKVIRVDAETHKCLVEYTQPDGDKYHGLVDIEWLEMQHAG